MRFPEDVTPGTPVCLVFKAQAFVPQPTPDRTGMEMVLNVITGNFRGYVEKEFGFLLETESHAGVGVIWTVNFADVLIVGLRKDVGRIARVQ